MGNEALWLRVVPIASAVVGAALASSWPAEANAEPASVEDQSQKACLEAFKRAQRLRRRGELLSARAELVACGQPQCHDVIEVKCMEWIAEVRQAIPTVVVAAKDADGNDLSRAEVSVDGEVVASTLDGLPLEVDPGPHDLSVIHDGLSISQRIVATQGARDRLLVVRFPPAARPRAVPASPRAPLPVLGWIGFGLGATGLIVGTATGIASLAEAKKLDCPNNVCFQFQAEALSTGRALAHTATASFVIAGVGTGVGLAALTWLRPPQSEQARLDVRPSLGLGTLGVEGNF